MRKLDLPQASRVAVPLGRARAGRLHHRVAVHHASARRAPQNAPSKTESPPPTIQDDETLVPDPKESADNNLTFPVDI